MNGLEQLRHTHPELVDESIKAFDRIMAGYAKVGRDLEAMQARLDALTPATPVNQTDEE